MGNNIMGDKGGLNFNNGSSNSGGGFNISNLFDLNKLFGSRGNNPLSNLTRMFNGTNRRQSRSILKLLPIEETYRLIKSGNCFLLDVRTEMEYNTIRIKGSVNVPLDKLQTDMPQIVPNKSECIIVYCSTGSRVRRASQILWSLGYDNICIWEGAGINTFAFADLIVYNDNRNRQEN